LKRIEYIKYDRRNMSIQMKTLNLLKIMINLLFNF
jgi:hypothetical protein